MANSGSWLARTMSTARAMTVRVLRPRKSNLISPAFSTHFMSNWVTTDSSEGLRYRGTTSLSGTSPMTTPAAWVLAWRGRPSRERAMSMSFFTEGSAFMRSVRRGSASRASSSLMPSLVGTSLAIWSTSA